MKRLSIIIMAMITSTAIGATMCSKNDATTIVLDPAINGANYGYSQANSTWWTSFSYGTIRGISACLSSNNGKSVGGYIADLHDNGESVVGGETNGLHCWCKMTHPMVSPWVFHYSFSSADVCARSCAYDCSNSARVDSNMRGGLFGSVRRQN